MNEKTRGHPLSSLVIEDGNSTSIYNNAYTWLDPWTELVLQTAIKNDQKKRNLEKS